MYRRIQSNGFVDINKVMMWNVHKQNLLALKQI